MKKLLFSLAFCASFFVACSDDDEIIEDSSNVEETFYIHIGNTEMIDVDYEIVSAVSNNTYVLDVDNDGIMTGVHAGSVELTVNNVNKYRVVVEGDYEIFPEPIFDWGATKSEIKARVKDGKFVEERENTLVYSDYGSATEVDYGFSSETGELIMVLAYVPSSGFTSSQINKFLKERFEVESILTITFGYNAYNEDDATVGVTVLADYSYNDESYYLFTYNRGNAVSE